MIVDIVCGQSPMHNVWTLTSIDPHIQGHDLAMVVFQLALVTV